ncbi:MAG: hypothetical protein HQL22_07275 [Candidatus Omnitrophica bacterium]|nr:hypothetical protein [Candidatus Omnitrophota bacterium]
MRKKFLCCILSFVFGFNSIGPLPQAYAQAIGMVNLPAPGEMVRMSQDFKPLQMKGIQVYDDNPLHVDFLIDKGETGLLGEPLKNEIVRLSKYFLTCLTVPEKDLWVNLSPYEKDRIAPESFGVTQMGKDLLEQDYLLKQITASLSFPEEELGRDFWQQVYARAFATFGTTDIPFDTLNKVWIVPQTARVYSRGNSAFVVESKLDVMLEKDYQATQHENAAAVSDPEDLQGKVYNQVVRDVLLPQLRREVNEGRHFAPVRQAFNAMILATWYKRHLSEGLLAKGYVGQNKVKGVDIDDKAAKEKIFEQYLQSFQKKVYNYVREDYDRFTQTTIPRKYVSGGLDFAAFGVKGDQSYAEQTTQGAMVLGPDLAMASINLSLANAGGKVVDFPDARTYVDTHPFKEIPRLLKTKAKRWLASLTVGIVLAVSGLSVGSVQAGQVEQAALLPQKAAIEQKISQKEYYLRHSQQVIKGGERMMVMSEIGWNQKKLEKINKEIAANEKAALIKAGAPTTLPQEGNVVEPELARPQPKMPSSSVVVAPVVNTPKPSVSDLVNNVASAVASSTPERVPAVDAGLDPLAEPVNLPATQVPVVVPAPAAPSVATVSVPTTAPVPAAPSEPVVSLPPSAVMPAVDVSLGLDALSQINAPVMDEPVNPSIVKSVKEFGVWGVCSALALAVVGFGVSLFKKKKAVPVIEAQTEGTPPPTPVADETNSEGDAKVHIVRGFKVPVPDAQEQEIMVKLRQEMKDSGLGKFNYKKSSPSHWMDQVAWLAGMGGALAAFGVEPVSLVASALLLPFVTRASYARKIWKHEVLGHALRAGFTSPLDKSTWKAAMSKRNLSGNWGREWINVLLPWRTPQGNPYVYFQTSAKNSEKIAKAGTAATSVLSVLSTAALSILGATGHLWAWPLLGVSGVTSLTTIVGAWLSDRIESKDGKTACGIIGFGRWGKIRQMAAQGDSFSFKWMKKMMRRLISRGGHSAGLVKMRMNRDGTVDIVEVKEMTTKHGWLRDLVGVLFSRLEKKIKPLDPELSIPGYILDLIVGHNRWATGGKVAVKASHPHVSGIRMEPVWDIKTGDLSKEAQSVVAVATKIYEQKNEKKLEKQEQVNASVIGHNGDNDAYQPLQMDPYNDAYQPLKNDRFIEDLDELREYFTRLTYFDGELPPGDSPIIAMQVLYHATQGNMRASARFAHTEVHHQTVDEIKAGMMTADEQQRMGDFLDSHFAPFAHALSRPGLKKNDKTLRDCYVTGAMAKENPALQVQYEMIQAYKKDLVAKLLQAVARGEIPETLARHWQGADAPQVVGRYVDMLVERFFTGDRFRVAQEFKARTKGTYGLFIYLSTDLNGVTLISRKQGVVFGYDLKRRIMAFASDTFSLQEADPDGRQLEKLIYLNPAGEGEILDVQISRDTGDLYLTPYSVDRKAYLDEEELKSRHQELTEDNPYWEKLPPITTLVEDLRDIPKGLRQVRDSFEPPRKRMPDNEGAAIEAAYKVDKKTFNYRSAEEMLQRLLSLWIEKKMLSHAAYMKILPDLQDRIRAAVYACSDAESGCSDDVKRMLRQEGAAGRESESVLMRLIRYRIMEEARILTKSVMSGDISSDELDAHFARVIPRLASRVLSKIVPRKLADLYDDWNYEVNSPSPEPENDGNAYDFLIAGYEKSAMIAKVIEQAMNSLFPGLSTKAVNSNDLLAYKHERLALNKIRTALILGDFGSNFPDLEGANILMHAIGEKNVFGMTSRIDSTLNVVLGQSLEKAAPFTNRVFVAGELRQAEASTYSEAVMMGCAVNLVFHLARRMNSLLPGEKPFGLALTAADEKAIVNMEDLMIQDAVRATGYDENGDPVTSSVFQKIDPKTKDPIDPQDVHGLITKRAKKIALRFMEVPVVNAFFWSYVIGFPSLLGGGILSLLTGQHAAGWVALEGALTLSLGGFILPYIYKYLTGRDGLNDRVGPMTNISNVGETGFYEMAALFYSKIFSRASKSMGSQPHGAHIRKDAISKLSPLMNRGSLISAHLPLNPYLLGIARNAIGQLKVTRTSILGIFRRFLSGAHAYTTSRKPFHDPKRNVSDSNIALGGDDKAPGKGTSEGVGLVFDKVIDPFGGYVMDKVQWGLAAYYSSLKGRLRTIEETTGRAAAGTTQTPVPPPEVLPERRRDGGFGVPKPPSGVLAGASAAQETAVSGGVDLSGRDMSMTVEENSAGQAGGLQALAPVTIESVTPEIGNIVPVTPMMLKSMLGEAYP